MSFFLHFSLYLFQEKFIQYITDGGIVTAQKVVVTDTEAEFQIQGGMHAVFDYEQVIMET